MKSPTLNSRDLLLLIDCARNAEMCRDLDLLRELLSQVWKDDEIDPNYSTFSEEIQAGLLRLSGVYVSERGRSRGWIDQQIRAKNILTQAIDIFASLGNREKSAEASISLAACYWYSGEVEEYNAILRTLETEFEANQCVYLQIQLNRIAYLDWQGDYDHALAIIDSLGECVETCPDQKLQAQFHNQAGITCQLVGENDKSVEQLLKASDVSRSLKNDIFLGLNLNCLAMTCRQASDFAAAHIYATEAISVFGSVGDTGWIPNVLDTRALIYLDEGRHDEALDTIDKAVSLFSGSEDYSGRVEAMFTKCRCLLRLHRGAEAFTLFSELGHLASVRIGETALHKYAKLLTEEVRYVTGKTLRERTDFLKKDLIREALHTSGGNIGDAAKALGETHQALRLCSRANIRISTMNSASSESPEKHSHQLRSPTRRSSMFSCPRA
jgi:tetratricopeptide (TPR) repeat protein